MLYLVFRHPTELAALMHELWNTIFYNRVTEAMLDVSVSAIFISAEAGGMENEPLEEVFGAEFQYPKVFFTLNLIKLTPVCFIESMTTTVERKGIVRITKVAFVSQMLNKLHDHVCLDFSWPDGVSYTTMLMSAMFSYSMFSDYQFESDVKKERQEWEVASRALQRQCLVRLLAGGVLLEPGCWQGVCFWNPQRSRL